MKSDPIKASNRHPSQVRDEQNEEEGSSQSVKSAQELLKVLVKALKNFKIYLPNNPVHQRFLKEFHGKLESYLNEYGDLVISVGQYTLTLQDQTIYENINRLESLAFKLFVDGIRQISFLEGMTEEESADFLELLGHHFDSERPDDDLVTLFWQKNFHHVKCQILEDYFSLLQENPQPEPESRAGFTNLIQSELNHKPAETNGEKPLLAEQAMTHHFNQVFRLTEDEIARVKQEMLKETEKDLIAEMIEIVYSVLQVEKNGQFFSEIIEILTGNMAKLLEDGDFIQAEKIVRLFVLLKEQIPPLPDSHIEALNQVILSVGQPEYLRKAEPHINELDEKNLTALSNFLEMLNPSAAFSIIDFLGKSKSRKMRKVLTDILVEMGKKDIMPITQRLHRSPWFVIRNLVQVIGRIGHQEALESLRKLVQYPDERVRKEVVHTISLIGIENEKVMEMMLFFLNDHDAAIRKQAIRNIQLRRYAKALPALMKIAESDEFFLKDMEERNLIFGALGRLGNDELIPLLKSYLQPTFFFWIKRKKKEEKALHAVTALKNLETPAATALLKEAKKHSYKTARDLAVRALFDIQKAEEMREIKRKHEVR